MADNYSKDVSSYTAEKCAAINKEKTDSVHENAVGQIIILGFRKKQRGGCRGCCFHYRRGWI